MGFLSIFLKQDTYQKMHRICLEIIMDTFKLVEFITLYGCFYKPKV